MSDILDALGYVGDSLGKPGRAVRGVLAGKGIDELLAAVPFSDSLGITDPGNATSGREVLNALGMDAGHGLGGDIAGFATEVATDPLTWMGAGLGSRIGSAAEKAAVARGPQYATTAADLQGMLGGFAAQAAPADAAMATRRISEIVNSPIASRLLSEIPEGASMLGAGAEASAFAGPAGVTRLGRTMAGDIGRPAGDGVLQATRATDFPMGAGRGWRSELLPQASGVGDSSLMESMLPVLDNQLAKSGLSFTDRHAGNFGMVGGKPVVIDPGAIAPALGTPITYQPMVTGANPSAPMNALLNALGATDKIRQGLTPSYLPMMTGAGAAGGGTVGALARYIGG